MENMTARQLIIAFVLFPNVTQLDFTGPLQFLSRIPCAIIHPMIQFFEEPHWVFEKPDLILSLSKEHFFARRSKAGR